MDTPLLAAGWFISSIPESLNSSIPEFLNSPIFCPRLLFNPKSLAQTWFIMITYKAPHLLKIASLLCCLSSRARAGRNQKSKIRGFPNISFWLSQCVRQIQCLWSRIPVNPLTCLKSYQMPVVCSDLCGRSG